MKNYPRVLIISPNVLNAPHSGGILMRNLFADWPSESLANIFSQYHVEPDLEICSQYYQLSERISFKPSQWPKRTYNFLIGKVDSIDGITSIKLTKKLLDWVEKFDPQVIYSQLGPLWLTRLTNKLSKMFQIPLAVHIMDDYIFEWPVNGKRNRNIFPIAQILHYWATREFEESLRIADVRMCISESMLEEYANRYGYAFEVFYNGIDVEKWLLSSEIRPEISEPLLVFYGGSIGENTNLNALKDISDVVVSMGKEGFPIRMEIACHERHYKYRDILEHEPFVKFIGMIPYEDMPDKLNKSDLLLLPFNFDEESIRFFRLSWPTKMAEYMISGTPILLYGPQNIGFVNYAAREGWAYVISEQDSNRIRDSFIQLGSDFDLRRNLIKKAKIIAKIKHDVRPIQQRFIELMFEVEKS